MRTLNYFFSRYSIFFAFLIVTIGLGVLAAPSGGHAQNGTGTPATPSSAPKKGDLPPGEGKAIAEKSCSVCHALTNITDSALSADEWRDTVQTMMDRGAAVPKDDVDTLVKYLAKNFGPKAADSGTSTSAAANSPAPTADPPAGLAGASPGASTHHKPGELPPGDGKAIAEKSCSVCHELTNITDSALSPDEWRDTVQTMIDRGAAVPKDDVDTLVKYLAKNFGPKPAASPTSTPAGPTTSSPASNH